ncbi:hypothetical protein CRYUN_Cryun21dG0085200 [Craigia yunnanensis]
MKFAVVHADKVLQKGFLVCTMLQRSQGSAALDITSGGNMTEYFQTSYKFIELSPHALISMHGSQPVAKNMICGYLKNRRSREAGILKAIENGAETLFDVVANVYSGVDCSFWIAVASNVRLHADHHAQQKKLPKRMKQFEMTCFAKELSRIRRKFREGKLHITITILFLLSMASFVVVLGTFINYHVRKYLVLEDSYFPRLNKFSPSSLWSPYSYILCNFAFPSSPSHPPFNFPELKTWIATQDLWHSMTDEELMRRASMVPNVLEYSYNRTPKVAFLFLSRGMLALAPLWEKFFMGHKGLYSIYIHTSPEFIDEPPVTSVFYKRRIPSKPVQWGSATMIDAERRLLANALLDCFNERFVLLSEACIPLFNFTTVYNYLINARHSFLGSFDDPRHTGRGRYNKQMWPIVSLADWRKGSQWFEVNRKIAIEIVSDEKYYPVFRDYCNPPCYIDEHYLPTLVSIIFPELNSNRSITWVDWSRAGPHPARYVRKDVSTALLNQVRQGFNCTYNGHTSSICFLFARKFHPSTLEPLLRIAPALLGFDPQ